MMFLYPLLLLWLGFCNSTNQNMVDFQGEWEGGWLEEVTLFPNQQLGLNFEDYLHIELDLPPKLCHGNSNSDPSSIWNEWMDEKFDLSIFDCQNDEVDPQNDSERISTEDTTAILESLMDCNFPRDVIPFANEIEASKYLENPLDFDDSLNISVEKSSPSPAAIVPEILIESPNISSEEIAQSPVSSPPSVSSSSSESSECVNTENDEFTAVDLSHLLDVEKCEKLSVSIQEGCAPCPNKSSLKGALRVRFHPYSAAPHPKLEFRKERKKVQNKEAAARYREKKRLQDQELCGEVSELEAKGKKLREKHDQLKNEISYLKSLMREMFKKRGLLK